MAAAPPTSIPLPDLSSFNSICLGAASSRRRGRKTVEALFLKSCLLINSRCSNRAERACAPAPVRPQAAPSCPRMRRCNIALLWGFAQLITADQCGGDKLIY